MLMWVFLKASYLAGSTLLKDENTGTLSFYVRDFTAAVDFDVLYV